MERDGPGAVVAGPGASSIADDGAERRTVVVHNTSRRVVRVSSHMPFDTVNPRLAFDRAAAVGFRLDLPAGDAERWAPGEEKPVGLVRFGGRGGAGDSP